jgi:hypothetical protein
MQQQNKFNCLYIIILYIKFNILKKILFFLSIFFVIKFILYICSVQSEQKNQFF